MLLGAVLCFEISVSSSLAQMTLSNGSFETGTFPPWETEGTASIETSIAGPAPDEGTFHALLETEKFDPGPTPDNPASDRMLETFLDLELGSLSDMGNGEAIEGAAIKQTFTVDSSEVGMFLNVSWDFLTDEVFFGSQNDFSFISLHLDGSNILLSELADVNSPGFVPSGEYYIEHTGYRVFSYQITSAGVYTLGLGVVDVVDNDVASALLVDNVHLSLVPEPWAFSLTAGFGLVTFVGLRRFRRFIKAHP